MYNVIVCEFLKLKKSYFYLIIVGLICFPPGFLVLGWLMQDDAFVTWNHYIIQAEQMSFMFVNVLIFSVIPGYIYTRENSYNTASTLYSYPISRTKIFGAKMIVISFLMLCIMVLQPLLTILGGLLLSHETLTKEIFLSHLRIHVYALLYHYAILPVAIIIGLLSKNVILPMVYGGVVILVNIFSMGMGMKGIDYIPTMYPISVLFNSIEYIGTGRQEAIIIPTGTTLPNVSIIIAVLTFIIGISLCTFYHLKTDID